MTGIAVVWRYYVGDRGGGRRPSSLKANKQKEKETIFYEHTLGQALACQWRLWAGKTLLSFQSLIID